MKRIIPFFCLTALIACKEDTIVQSENMPQRNYEIFWTDFNTNYPVFGLNGIKWDSVYKVNAPKINASTDDATLYNIMKSNVLLLKDAHSDLITPSNSSLGYYFTFINQKPANFISRNLIFSKYVEPIQSNNANLSFGKVINQDIGYFYIGGFQDSQNDYLLIDAFLSKFENAKGLIFDVRNNGGGNENYAQIIANRLTDKTLTYRYAANRAGSGYSDFIFYPLMLIPAGKTQFTKKVVLLTNRRTFSAAEDFSLMLKSLPNTVHIGDTTFGGVATNPIIKTLPNGWMYRMSRSMECDNNQKPIKNGIAPNIPVQISKSDTDNGIDRILEAAVKNINQ